MKKYLFLVVILATVVALAPAAAQKGPAEGVARAMSSDPDAGTTQDGVPDSMVSVDMTGAESWDLFGDPDNQILTEVMGAGAIVTGANWNLTITTVGASWLSEADAVLGSTSTPQIGLTPGFMDGNPGSMTYTDGIDFTDEVLPNITLDADGIFVIELAESFDDVADAVDANYDSGTYDFQFIAGAPVPTMPTMATVALVVALLALGTFMLRRRARAN